METKDVLIVTDDAGPIRRIAEQIAAELSGQQVVIRAARDFSGSDILPAEVCFFGCEEPNPESFTYLTEVLRHINLAGRSCGIFSSRSGGAVDYLSAMVRDSELALYPRPFLSGGSGELKSWVQAVLALHPHTNP